MPLYSLDVLIPFFFVLAIVWGGLEVGSVFRNKAVKAIISLVIAVFAITSAELVAFINQALPIAVVLFVIVFFIAFIKKPFESRGGGERDFTLLVIVAVLILIFLATQGTEYIRDYFPGIGQITQDNILVGAGMLILMLIFYSAYKKWSG